MIIYPTHLLPYPSINISGATHPVLATTQFEIALRQREVYSFAEQDLALQILLNDFQFDYFKSWVKVMLKSGSLSFQMPLPGVDGIINADVKIINGALTWAKDSMFWRVSFNVREEQPEIIDPGIIEFLSSLDAGYAEGFSSMAGILHLQLNSFYGQSGLSPAVTAFINQHS